MSNFFRRCDCESSDCHPKADCEKQATVKTTHSTICKDCAAKMPEEYLACKVCDSRDHFTSEHYILGKGKQ